VAAALAAAASAAEEATAAVPEEDEFMKGKGESPFPFLQISPKPLSLRGAKRRGNPFSRCKIFQRRTDCHTILRMVRNDMGIWEFLRFQGLPVPSSVRFAATFPPGKVFCLYVFASVSAILRPCTARAIDNRPYGFRSLEIGAL
jgi:hypothetical protein